MSALTVGYLSLTSKEIDISSITSIVEILKQKIPEVFKTFQDIESFIIANQLDGISDYEGILNKFQAQLTIFVNHNQDHSITETLEKIEHRTFIVLELIKCIESEYNDCLDRSPNSSSNIMKLSKVKKNAPEDVDMMKEAITHEYTRYESRMLKYVNLQRINILKSLVFIEDNIIKLNPGQSSTTHDFYN